MIALPLARAQLLTLPGVVGVGYGLKERDGALTHVPAWRVYVREKRPLRGMRIAERIRPLIAGVPTDVIECAPVHACAGSAAPLALAGASIANAKGVPGTLGCFAWHQDDGRPVMLSTWHVLFGRGGEAQHMVWLVDGRRGATRFHEIGRTLDGRIGTVPVNGNECYVDCAIASYTPARCDPLDGGLVRACRRWFDWCRMRWRIGAGSIEGPVAGHDAAILGARVTKTGAATHTTDGIVVDVCYPDVAMVEQRSYPAPGQLLLRSAAPDRPFSAEGDFGRRGDQRDAARRRPAVGHQCARGRRRQSHLPGTAGAAHPAPRAWAERHARVTTCN